jgi:N-acetylmuramic acid 6-phosphate etherase
MNSREKTAHFLEIASQFKLGHLVTESFHPKSKNLSTLVKSDLSAALNLFQEIDRDALNAMREREADLWELSSQIQDTLKKGNKVFMCGCGATGRLSLVLETLFRQKFGDTSQVFSFMAGGDFALIKSVESFEDKTNYGERQLLELGFGPQDLLLASTEGGETPFVIGAANKAAAVSQRAPYFLYCNPDETLRPIERSQEVIENRNIKKINLTVGPMTISGSTRMQASTVLMLGIGVGLLFSHDSQESFSAFYQDYLTRLMGADYSVMAPLTSLEAKLYQEKKYLNYLTDPALAISILTDTTERSPTFSLRGFENKLESSERSLSYLFVAGTQNSREAWRALLSRDPRPLEWPELEGRISMEKLLGFDISQAGLKARQAAVATENFVLQSEGGVVKIDFGANHLRFNWGDDNLFTHLMLKMILNAHSTSIMGLLGRYEGNVMTWVRASNNKLIDRAARYVQELLRMQGKSAEYGDVVLKIFEEADRLTENEPVVLKVLERY